MRPLLHALRRLLSFERRRAGGLRLTRPSGASGSAGSSGGPDQRAVTPSQHPAASGAGAPLPPQWGLGPRPQAALLTAHAEHVVGALYRALLLRAADRHERSGCAALVRQGQLSVVIGALLRSDELAQRGHSAQSLARSVCEVLLRGGDPRVEASLVVALRQGLGARELFELLSGPAFLATLPGRPRRSATAEVAAVAVRRAACAGA